jgi:LacI family transcriptional regulator
MNAMPGGKKLSQTHLAKELGISQALVSLVLNGRRQGINPETYDRVWALATKRGYHPKGMKFAASPAARPRQVGLILRAPLRLNTPSNYFRHIEHGLHSALAARGFNTVFFGSEDELNPAKLRQFFEPGHFFLGVVLLGEVARSFLGALQQVERRIVAVSARYPGQCHSVIGNEPQALDLLVRHLHTLGHRRIGWLGGNSGLSGHEVRLASFKAALREAGLPLDPRYCAAFEQADRAEGLEAVLAMLPYTRRKDFPTAFVCYNTLMALGAVRAFARAGWRLPDDISVASADASPVGATEQPRITAAGAAPDKLGEAAARLILDSTGSDDESFTDLMVSAQLHVGDTTGPAGRRPFASVNGRPQSFRGANPAVLIAPEAEEDTPPSPAAAAS